MLTRRLPIALLLTLIVPLAPACGDDDGGQHQNDAGPGQDAAPGQDAGPGQDAEPGQDAGSGQDAGPGSDATIWAPTTGTSWHIQYSGLPVDTSVNATVYNLDLEDTEPSLITSLHAAGRRLQCYFSAGSWEDWRSDADDFPADAIGDEMEGWPGERWLDVRHAGLRPIMAARLDLAVTKGCDGVDPDNVNGYTNDTGFPLTYEDQLAYNLWLAAEAHARGLAIGLKNDVEQIVDLEPFFEWALNEECLSYDECNLMDPFIASGKPVFHLEYVDDPADGPARLAEVCGDPTITGFSTLVKTWDLDAWYLACE